MSEKLRNAEQPQKGNMRESVEKIGSKKEVKPQEGDKNDDKVRRL